MILNMECRDAMSRLPDCSVDAIVTDPPYGLSKQPDMTEVLRHWLAGDDYKASGGGFMGKSWDSFVPGPSVWKEAIRCLKPGAWAVVFAGSRTQDLMGLSLRLAGFEIMDTGMWLYASGFPKSMDIGKAIDKASGAEREVVGVAGRSGSSRSCTAGDFAGGEYLTTAPATEAAKQWDGWGTALKPGYEPFILARKPLDGTYANNVLTHGCGALNIDGCRIATDDGVDRSRPPRTPNNILGGGRGTNLTASEHNEAGRWPANIVTSDLDEPWAKYFYCAKASKRDRDEGLEHLGLTESAELVDREPDSAGVDSPRAGAGRTSGRRNIHPTVKPTDLMRYLCRLVTPPGGLVLDPFSGSGSTGKAAALEGFNFLGFELDSQYAEIANARCDAMREEYRKMITLAEHKDGQLTGRVAYLECSRDDLTDLLPLLGGPAPQDISKGIVTPTVFAYNAKVYGQEVSVDALFKVEVAPGIWAPYGSPAATLDKLDYKD